MPSTRSEMRVPEPDTGASTACRRTPPGNVPSAMGLASSRRTPHALAMRIAARRASASSGMPTSTSTSPPPRSTQACPPLMRISVTPGASTTEARAGFMPRWRARSSSRIEAASAAPQPGRAARETARAGGSPRARSRRALVMSGLQEEGVVPLVRPLPGEGCGQV